MLNDKAWAFSEPIKAILIPIIRREGKTKFRRVLAKSKPSILLRFAQDGITIEGTPLRDSVRYCLYWLCKSVLKSGFLADTWRDAVDDKVVEAVANTPPKDLGDLVEKTIDALVELVF